MLTAEAKRRAEEELLQELDEYLDGTEAEELKALLASQPAQSGQPGAEAPAPPSVGAQKGR